MEPGIGGDDKFALVRDVIHKHTGMTPAPELPPPRIHAYGKVTNAKPNAERYCRITTSLAGGNCCGNLHVETQTRCP